ncbi:MAG: phosphoserine phosphatase SerB [Alphaproteobacteria bacterium]|nr:phosphoserine phosphatase SerB [Alphaproteobacteria bacterium]
MQQILTLVGAHQTGLAQTLVDAATAALQSSGIGCGVPDWLAPALACDIAIGPCEATPTMAFLAARLQNQPVDFAIQPVAGRRKRLLLADMDSTIVMGETLDELADQAGLGERIAAVTARAMNGEIEFQTALKERVALLAQLPVAALERTLERLALMPGACQLVRTMRHHGAHTLLVSGGFRYFTTRVAQRVGFDGDEANDLEIADGRLTGRVREPILDKDAKLAHLDRAVARLAITRRDVVAVGDGANDLAMLEAAGLGVAYRAKPVVAARVLVRVDHGDLTALLYFQGYCRDDIRG